MFVDGPSTSLNPIVLSLCVISYVQTPAYCFLPKSTLPYGDLDVRPEFILTTYSIVAPMVTLRSSVKRPASAGPAVEEEIKTAGNNTKRQKQRVGTRRVQPQAPGTRQQTPPASTQLVEDVPSKRDLQGHSNKERKPNSFEQVFENARTSSIHETKKVIQSLRILNKRECTPALASSGPNATNAVYLVDQLFTGPPIPGRAWRSTVEYHQAKPRTKHNRAVYYISDNTQRRYFGNSVVDDQFTLAMVNQIVSDIADAVNRFPGQVEDITKAKPPMSMQYSVLAQQIISAASRRRFSVPTILLAPQLSIIGRGLHSVLKQTGVLQSSEQKMLRARSKP